MVVVLALIFSTGSGTELTRRSFTLGVIFAVLLFVSVFLHELAHAATARAFGRRVDEVVITLWGGHTSFDGAGLTPRVQGLVAAAGPVANLVVAGLAYVPIWLGWVSVDLLDRLTGDVWLYAALQWVIWANVLLAIFNALPGIPMDGGRVLESLVWAGTGSRYTGLRVAAWGGRVVAVGFVIYSLGGPLLQGRAPSAFEVVWAGLIFMLLWPAASHALRMSQVLQARDSMSVAALMLPAVAMEHHRSVRDALALAQSAGAAEVIVVNPTGQAAGHFPVSLASSVPAEERDATTLVSVTMPLPQGATISVDATGSDVTQALEQWWGKTDVVVVTDAGGFAGVLRLTDAMKALQ